MASTQIIKLELGEAVLSKVNSSTKLLTIMNGMLVLGVKPQTTQLKKLLEAAAPLVNDLQAVDGQVRKKIETELSDNMKAEMNKIYRSYDGAIIMGEGSSEKDKKDYAKDLKRLYVKSSSVFGKKGTFVSELKKALAKLDGLPEELFVALGVAKIRTTLETMMADYEANFVSKVDVSVQKNGSVQSAFEKLKAMYKSIINYLKSVQDPNMAENENEFVKRLNQHLVEYSAAQKFAETLRKKAAVELAEKKKAEAEASKRY